MSTATENFESLDQAIVRAAESTAANVRAARASIGAVIFGVLVWRGVGVNVGELVGVIVGVSVGASVGVGVKLATTGIT